MKEELTISDMMKKAHDNGVKICADINRRGKLAVLITDERNAIYSKKVNPGEYKHTNKTIELALYNAHKYVYNKLTNKI